MSEKRYKRRRKQGINNRLVLGIGLLTLWILAFSIAVFFLFFSGKDSTVLRELANEETAQRTGNSDSGWSRLIIDCRNFKAGGC